MSLDRRKDAKMVNMTKPSHYAGWSVTYDLLKESF